MPNPDHKDSGTLDSKECSYLKGCPVFARFRSEALGSIWIMLYCRGSEKSKCARLKLREAGEDVPITLLPNGKHLPELDREL